MKKIAAWTVLCLIVVSAISFALPGEASAFDWKPSPAEKLGRGVSNVFFGAVLEIPYHFGKEMERTNPVGATVSGLLKGVMLAVVRIAAGAADIVTFPVPTPQLIADFDA